LRWINALSTEPMEGCHTKTQGRSKMCQTCHQTAPIMTVVDDDSAVRAALMFALQAEGYEVRAFADAESLLSECEVAHPGCLIIDYGLPRLNGLELMRRLRDRGVVTPAVLITTLRPGVRAVAAALGVPVVEKPLLTDTLMDTVRQLIDADRPCRD
jgi:FixJ family two-component response regulator